MRPIQAKLTITQPGDAHEQEADRVADAVMRTPSPATPEQSIARVKPSIAGPTAQRKCTDCEEERKKNATGEEHGKGPGVAISRKATPGAQMHVTPSVASGIQAMRGGGRALPATTRAFFEPRLCADFSRVRVHTDTRAEESANSIGARAFTVGRDIGFAKGQYAPESQEGRRLLAHELTHVIQQGDVGPASATLARGLDGSEVVQRAGDPAKIPPGLPCPTDLTPGKPAGVDLRFSIRETTITAAQTAQLTAFRATWLAAGGTDDVLVHGYASTIGDQAFNWTLSCDRAEAVRAELIKLGIPAVRINTVAHGASTDFGAGAAANQHVVVSTSAGVLPLPLAAGVLTPDDNFAGRSTTRFGVGETIQLSFVSFPPRPAADFGGLEWHLASGGGALTAVTAVGTASYAAPAVAGAVRLELRVAGGATAGRVVSSHGLTIVAPSGVRMIDIPATAPSFSPSGPIPSTLWGAGFQANVFVDPKDVSFRGVVFGEGTVGSVISGSFLSVFAGPHHVNTFGPGHGGNAVTGTQVSPPADGIFSGTRSPSTTLGPLKFCGDSDFLWAIPWEFSVAGGPRTRFATANHHETSTTLCDATIEKGGAGPFKRSI
jgi:outer membrane protein OmpA-like peptidoglycan-associated protein